MATAERASEGLTHLPRGGVVVATGAGPIQFGCPPETLKDSLALGLPVPTCYVVPEERFDRSEGVNLCEVEFPAYYNFFVLGRQITLVADAEGERRVRAVLGETLFGPQRYDLDLEYDPSIPAEARPDLARECGQFRRDPRDPSSRLELEALIRFARLDEQGRVRLDAEAGAPVELQRLTEGQGWVVREGGRELARVPARVRLPGRQSTPEVAPFDPPAFGVSVLGSSHGFDPEGKTTGFLLWINHRGLLVDPPVGARDLLAAAGIAPKLIDGIVLTHCHADHDSGTFQKVLEEGRVAIYTTPTILGSFLRKYSALSGLDEDVLRRTFVYRPVRIGAPLRVHGGELRFFYTLHSIPTIGFEAWYGGQSLAFSGDTLYDPQRIEEMVAQGTLTRARADSLLDFPWHHTVVLHEAGVPPLHTPVRVLAELPATVKRRLYLLHIAEKDVPPDQGLRVPPVGVEHTIRIPVRPPRHAEAIELLDVLAGIDLFRGFSLARAREMLAMAERVRLRAGERVISQGSPGDAFYVICSGIASVRQDGQELKRYAAGDYFGETALVLDQPRNADVDAVTDLDLVKIGRYDFLYLLRGTDVPRRLVRLARMREERSWELFHRNSALQPLTSGQKTQLQSYLEVITREPGDALWSAGRPPDAAFVVDEGKVVLEGYGSGPQEYGPGAFLGETDALVRGSPASGSARVEARARLFRVRRADLVRWFDENPGVHLAFIGARAVE